MVGSMGHTFGFTAGLCHSGVQGNIACFDGDGSILMHAGALTTVSSLPPKTKLLHICFNNGLHESVGKQPTAFKKENVCISGVARNMGYTKVFEISTEEEAEKLIKQFEEI